MTKTSKPNRAALIKARDNLVRHLSNDNKLRDATRRLGPFLVEHAMHSTGESLRGVGRRANLSPTYLSQVRSGRTLISFGAFVALVELL